MPFQSPLLVLDTCLYRRAQVTRCAAERVRLDPSVKSARVEPWRIHSVHTSHPAPYLFDGHCIRAFPGFREDCVQSPGWIVYRWHIHNSNCKQKSRPHATALIVSKSFSLSDDSSTLSRQHPCTQNGAASGGRWCAAKGTFSIALVNCGTMGTSLNSNDYRCHFFFRPKKKRHQ